MLLIAVMTGVAIFVIAQIIINMAALIGICILAIVILIVVSKATDHDFAKRRRMRSRR